MDLMAVFEIIKLAPEGFTLFIVIIVFGASLFLKKKDVDLTQVTSISKLQTEQLTQLIEQNKNLAKELGAVRDELSQAYEVINDMRQRITELEEMLKSVNRNTRPGDLGEN